MPDSNAIRSFAVTVLFWIAVLVWLPAATFVTVVWGWGMDLSGALGTRVFISALAFLVPGLAVLGYLNGAGWARFGKALVLSAIGVVGVALARVIARSLYPEYPERGPHEWIAAATILPALVLPTGVMVWWKRLGIGARSCQLYVAWAVLVLGGTVALFSRRVESALPLSVTGVTRWERNDIQDYAHYFLRAELDLNAAARYAADLGMTRSEAGFSCGEEEAPFADSERAQPFPVVWGRDDRVSEGDTDKYPSGWSGCFTRAAWASQTLLVCRICDWGI